MKLQTTPFKDLIIISSKKILIKEVLLSGSL